MHFKKLKIANVGPFTTFETELTRGSIGIFGANGRGKSTLLNLMYALLSNDFGRFPGVKADAVRNTATTREESYIYGEIEHAGKLVTIRRSLRFHPTTLVTCDGERETNTGKAQDMIHRILGVDSRLLNLYVFKCQDAIYDFLMSSPAERAKAYQVLCRTEKCEALWNMLGKFLNEDRDVNAQIVDNSDELTAEIAQTDAALKVLEEQRKQAVELQCSKKFFAIYSDRVAAAQRRDILREQLQAANATIKDTRATLEEVKKSYADAKAELERLQMKRESCVAKATEVINALKNWSQYVAYQERRDKLDREYAAIQAERQNLATLRLAVVVPPRLEEAQTLQIEVARYETELRDAEDKIRVFASSGVVACPMCGTSVTHLQEHLAELRKIAEAHPKKIKRLREEIAAIDAYDRAEKAYAKKYDTLRTKLEQNLATSEGLQVIEAPEESEAALRTWLGKWDDLVTQKLPAAEKKAQAASTQLARIRERHKSAKTHKRNLATEIATLHVSEAKLEKAVQRLSEHTVATTKIAAIDGEMKGLKRIKEDKVKSRNALKAKLQRTRKLQQMARVISRTRDILHRDVLPQRVAQSNLARMEGDINANLKFFADPFWVETDEALSFIVHKPGEPPQSAERLSTGQRVVLALAFWPTVAALWQHDLGMLALDEPTANLDDGNRKYLAEALAALTAKVRGNRQLLMVTHDSNLRSSFDQVIDL